MVDDFTLTADQVPDPPESGLWANVLRWCICVMDPKDTRTPFIASCLAHALRNGGLTEGQQEACVRITQSVLLGWQEGILVCQNTAPTANTAPTINPPRTLQ
jgi:hypothetical protein